MKLYYTDAEAKELDSQWWEKIPYEENKALVDDYRQKYDEYQKVMDMALCTETFGYVYSGLFIEKYGIFVTRKLNSFFDEQSKSHEFMDNFRVAKKDSPEDVKQYKALRKKGCCGFFDEELEIEGETYLVGFNFGH